MNKVATAPAPPALSDSERLDWLRLIRSENVGPRTFYQLLLTFGSASRALDAMPELARRGGAKRIKICSLAQAERELEQAARQSVVFIAQREPAYPALLASLADAPPLLAVRGQPERLQDRAVAIVGARNASAAGLKFAEMIARALGDAGFVVVSGLARGIDAAAHRASLRSGTVAVLAGGPDRIYPPENIPLLDALLAQGAAVTEMPMGWEPRGRDFPRRNRLISGLALAVVVVEAAQRSGSLITARFAAEQGREVLAVPGSPLDPRCEGSNALLKQGAALVTNIDDILSALGPLRPTEPGWQEEAREPPLPCVDPADSERSAVARLLGPTPVTLDDLIRLSGATPASVRTVLLELELAGRAGRQGDGFVAWERSAEA